MQKTSRLVRTKTLSDSEQKVPNYRSAFQIKEQRLLRMIQATTLNLSPSEYRENVRIIHSAELRRI